MPRTVELVTDSTSLDAERAAGLGVVVVPLQVVIGTTAYDEGGELESQAVAAALRRRASVGTSRPAPEAFLRVYEEAAERGMSAVVSVHLSGEVSGTYASAELAARGASIPVYPVDSRQLGMATGFAVESAAGALDAGSSAQEAAACARARAAASTALFYVDTLDHLRRGGRVSAAAALFGSALAVKPLLHIDDGKVVPLEKVRTATKAISRLEELAVLAAGDQRVDLAVSHLADHDRAAALADRLREQIPRVDELVVTEVGAVIGAHVGPGMLGVVVSPRVFPST
jgi:fatty acid kinase fatty acid binding subunit